MSQRSDQITVFDSLPIDDMQCYYSFQSLQLNRTTPTCLPPPPVPLALASPTAPLLPPLPL
ncbi:hypothetical protein E2C01_079100 [Portunus trituberculatus]|uniref:Uncharacterized protein n=1 Tax=Portunus trituberculatus TaxID=210409 RepID=A0A5B7IKK8_PORTR|nr:hypothetical protein [Portunus trituberculatus]